MDSKFLLDEGLFFCQFPQHQSRYPVYESAIACNEAYGEAIQKVNSPVQCTPSGESLKDD